MLSPMQTGGSAAPEALALCKGLQSVGSTPRQVPGVSGCVPEGRSGSAAEGEP